MSSNKVVETIIGAIFLILCINFIWLVRSFTNPGPSGGSYYTIRAAFDRADGIAVGSAVTVSGVKVGTVLKQYLDKNNYSAVLELAINKDVTVPSDTLAEIVSSSLVGDRYVSLVPGADQEHLKDGDMIEFTQSSISLEGLISKFMFGMDSNNAGKEGAEKDDISLSEDEENKYKENGSVGKIEHEHHAIDLNEGSADNGVKNPDHKMSNTDDELDGKVGVSPSSPSAASQIRPMIYQYMPLDNEFQKEVSGSSYIDLVKAD